MNTYPDWWLTAMKYLRTVSGTVYADRLEAFVLKRAKESSAEIEYDKKRGITDFLNCLNFENGVYNMNGEDMNFLKTHPITGEIYTVPYMRTVLDPLIANRYDDYSYNRYLYEDSFQADEGRLFFVESAAHGEAVGCYSLDRKSGEITVDFATLRQEHPDKLIAVKSFNINDIYDYFDKLYSGTLPLSFGRINAAEVIFLNDTQISVSNDAAVIPNCTRGAVFAGATFEGDVEVSNLSFDFTQKQSEADGYNNEIIDFRNARFFGKILLRGIRLFNTSIDNRITFEDARISGDFEISNCEFEHASLFCFQMIMGKFIRQNSESNDYHRIILNNTRFADDAEIDFVDTELGHGEAVIKNISSVPSAALCFHPSTGGKNGKTDVCPDVRLIIKNCEISRNLTLSNISELSFQKSRNSGVIICGDDWLDVDREKWLKTHGKKYRRKSRGFTATPINNPLLLAVYNCCPSDYNNSGNKTHKLGFYKAKDFVMLKENFASQGQYDDEDTAFILYMEFKPYIDSFNKGKKLDEIRPKKATAFLYKILYVTGKYGISPMRVVRALIATVVIFSVVYFIISTSNPGESYSLGQLFIDTKGNLPELAQSLLPESIKDKDSLILESIGSFLYSLESIVPFISEFEPINLGVLVASAVENFIGSFLVGYFSVAVVRKTLR